MKMHKTYLVGYLLLLIGVLAACAGQGPAESGAAEAGETAVESAAAVDMADLPRNADGYVDISVDQLAIMLEEKNFTFVNVHIPYDGELPQTDLFIPFNEIPDHLAELPDKDAPIVLYCRSGNMTTSAAEELVDLGYTNVYELDGGFRAWEAAGHEVLYNQ